MCFNGGSPFGFGKRAFEDERHILPCGSFLLGSFLHCELPCYLTQSPCYNQVLTGILPFDHPSRSQIAWHIRYAVEQARPRDPGQNLWLPDPVWNMITAGWNRKPEQRCELLTMHRVFLASSRQEDQGFETGESSARNSVDHPTTGLVAHTETGRQTTRTAPRIETGRQQRGKLLPRIASFFQFLRDPEPEIQRRVDEMDEAILFTVSTNPRLTRDAASREIRHARSGATGAIQPALQNVQPTPRDPNLHAHPRLFRKLGPSRIWGFC